MEPLGVFQTLGPSLANSAIAALVFSYLWARDRERHLAIWALAWGLWVVRYAYGLALGQAALEPGDHVLPLLALARGALIVWGSYALVRRDLPRAWLVVWTADLLLIGTEAIASPAMAIAGPSGAVHYLLFAANLAWAGLLLWRAPTLPRLEASIAGLALFVFGVIQTTYPLLGILGEGYTTSIYVMVYVLQTVIPIGVLLLYLERTSQENRALNAELAEALTHVLSEHIPICSHCKSIRDDGAWVQLERYLSERTEARFSHGICPSCYERHYSD